MSTDRYRKMAAIVVIAIVAIAAIVILTTPDQRSDDIVIIYTADVHCAVDGDIGYAGVKSLNDELSSKYKHVILVDSGDFSQGGTFGLFTDGLAIVDLMNQAGYDFATIGNHDFGYHIDGLSAMAGLADFKIMSCNLSYTGEKGDPFESISSYQVETYGDVTLGFVGITTPLTVNTVSKNCLSEDGKIVVDLMQDDVDGFYTEVQGCIDACRTEGADKVILLSHLGDTFDGPFSSYSLIANTTGADIVLDGHSHSIIEGKEVQSKDGKDVILTAAGSYLNRVGVLTISSDGMNANLLESYDEKDRSVKESIDRYQALFDEYVGQVIVHLDSPIKDVREDGTYSVRNEETVIGDMITDSFRITLDTDIAVINGGGIRSSIPAGDVTINDVLTVLPFYNQMVVMTVKGSDILDMLEFSCSVIEREVSDGTNAIGEFGGFQSVSGIKFRVDTSFDSNVAKDSTGNFLSVDGKRRVSDVRVLDKDSGEYVTLDPKKEYTIATIDFVATGGDGFSMLSKYSAEWVGGYYDSEVFVSYLADHASEIEEMYRSTDDRIVRI